MLRYLQLGWFEADSIGTVGSEGGTSFAADERAWYCWECCSLEWCLFAEQCL